MQDIEIHSRLGTFAGFRTDDVAYFDREDDRTGEVVRHYVLIEQGIKLMHEPWGWKDSWYADVVQIDQSENAMSLRDLYVDIVIEGNGPTYRLLDLPELVDAHARDEIETSEFHYALRSLHAFVDGHLHRRKDFPPTIIRPCMPTADLR
jgi:predicted RNA-binding protein associated with RNAse of E/G family